MSKASEWKRREPLGFVGSHLAAHVNLAGAAEIRSGLTDPQVVHVPADQAVALGRWLLDTFGEFARPNHGAVIDALKGDTR